MAIHFLKDRKKRYIFLLPVVFLLLNAFYYQYATRSIHASILHEKYVDTVIQVESLAAAVEVDPARLWEDHELSIRHSVEFLDALPMVYAAAYRPMNGALIRITDRVFTTSFDPLVYAEFLTAVESQEIGNLEIDFTAEDGSFHEMHLYFRYMPMYAPPGSRYLVVMGVSAQSIVTPIPALISIGQWISMSITFILNIWLIIMIARLGDLFPLSECETCEKRDRRR